MKIVNTLAGVLVVCLSALLLAMQEVTPEAVGAFLGRVAAAFLLAFLFGKLLYFAGRKSPTAGRIGFLAGLGWVIVGCLGMIGLQLRETDPIMEARDQLDDYNTALEAHLRDPAHNPEPNRLEHLSSIQSMLVSDTANPASDESRLARILVATAQAALEQTARWEGLMLRLDEAVVWEFGDIMSKEQLDSRLEVIKEYQAGIREYETWFQNQVSALQNSPDVKDMSVEDRALFLKGLRTKQAQVEKPLEAWFSAHRANSEHMHAVTVLMAEHWGLWRYREKGKFIEFDDDEARTEYERLVEAAIVAENQINASALELAERQQVRPN